MAKLCEECADKLRTISWAHMHVLESLCTYNDLLPFVTKLDYNSEPNECDIFAWLEHAGYVVSTENGEAHKLYYKLNTNNALHLPGRNEYCWCRFAKRD